MPFFGKIRRRHAEAGMRYDVYPCETSWLLQSLTTGAIVAASGFNGMVSSSHSVALVPGDEHQL
jgi:hypothetical protein